MVPSNGANNSHMHVNGTSATSSSAWPSSELTAASLVSRPKGISDLKLQKNDLSKNSNIDFANFTNFASTTTTSSAASIGTDPFLDNSNNNAGSGGYGRTDLFADFNDNFGADPLPTKTTAKPAFDPFGVSTSGKPRGSSPRFAATFDDDDDPFGEALVPPKRLQEEVNNNINVPRSNGGDSKKIKAAASNSGRRDSTGKYSEDYSKNFDNDLEEVLKRSLFDQ